LEEFLLKRVSIFIVVVLIALGAVSQANSLAQPQKSQKRSTRRAKPTPTPAPDMRVEASQVAAQIRKVSNFIYIYGKVVNSLEVAEEQAKTDQVSTKAQALNKENKDRLVASIDGLRAEMEEVAKSFQANPRLQVQYLKLSYATEAALDAARLASAGRYNDAGRSLVAVVERLTDTIISMRL
jgi:hypothetical protein